MISGVKNCLKVRGWYWPASNNKIRKEGLKMMKKMIAFYSTWVLD